jgi:multicomponent Na+:H+ antiporter subunit B
MSENPDPGPGRARAAESSLILRTAALYLLPLLLLFSVFLLVRGHDEPGGGFAGGLAASAAFVLFAIAHGTSSARWGLPGTPLRLTALGLSLAGGSGVAGMFFGRSFFASLWGDLPLPVLGEVGTPLLFDAGVYLTVIGAVLVMIFSLMEDE